MQRSLVHVVILALVLISAPAPAVTAQEATPPAAETDRPACATTLGAAGTPTAADDADLAGWQTVPLTDARTGDAFTVGDFLGCAVFVDMMATWCPSCRQQMEYVAAAAKELDPDQFVFLSISVETELVNKDLARYADDASFDWRFSVATPDALKAIVDEFGREAILPPSVPHVIVEPDGTYGDLHTGYSEPDEIVELMKAAAAA
ncbi:MAG: hypothetical protein AVDCRST_MAG49-2748 [uncultured Thermomicrobiales bacterium]|uniref:Thioredoxin domain-containing protein n=1 Tax=uncultured Thermomicrobiales bacterium TaxID=1645740 RepID=A0A6J4V363_9BACT|nr:MAG: hypothetical protein AVDCRST_MAG49-2748 [uncultured Thermomicrobiales bacterium]